MPTSVLTTPDASGPDPSAPSSADARLPHEALEPPRLLPTDQVSTADTQA